MLPDDEGALLEDEQDLREFDQSVPENVRLGEQQIGRAASIQPTAPKLSAAALGMQRQQHGDPQPFSHGARERGQS